MNTDDLPLLVLPTELDDNAAVALLEFFYEAARVLEHHYAGQLHRYYHRPDERQRALFKENDPPF